MSTNILPTRLTPDTADVDSVEQRRRQTVLEEWFGIAGGKLCGDAVGAVDEVYGLCT